MTVSASGARGKSDGNDVTQTNTEIVAGNQVTLESGDDTNLKGAVVSAQQVTAKVGKDLNIESLQDTSKFASKQASIGASVTIGAGAGGSFSASKSSVKSDFASVTQQSGIRAGDGGFDVEVQGNTDLKGGAITSTQAAIDQNNNRFETASLNTSDIQNKASFSAKSVGISASTGGSGFSPSGTSLGFGKDSGNAASTTQAAISGIVGNKDARTGDAETGISKIFDADKVQKEINAQVLITQTFGREAPKAAANFAESQSKDLEAQAKAADKAGDTNTAQTLRAEAKQWDEGGIYRIALQTAVGGLNGGVSGALGAGATAAAAPLLTELQTNIAQQLKAAGASDTVAQLAGQAVSLTAAAGISAAASSGNVSGIAGGLNVDANNRQMHFNSYLAAKDKCKAAPSSTGCQTIERIGGMRSQIVDFLALPESNVAANFGADGKVVSFTVIDKQSNQPLLILEPAEFQAYREASLATRGQYLLAPQYSLDLGSAIIYGGRGDAQRAFEHLEYVVTSPEYIFTAATGAAGVALSRASALANEVNTAKSLVDDAKIAAANAERAASDGSLTGAKASTSNNAQNRATHEILKDDLRIAMEKPVVSDPSLSIIVDKLYRPDATVGSGSTAAAVREELATGQPVGGAFHSQKARDSIITLQKWLDNNPTARSGDRAAAENIIRDMNNALRGQ